MPTQPARGPLSRVSRRLGAALAALSLLAGCAAHPLPAQSQLEFPDDDALRLVRLPASVEHPWHASDGVDPDTRSGRGEAYDCLTGWRQVGTWEAGEPTGDLELWLGTQLRFRGALDAEGVLTGTLFTTAWEDRLELTLGDLTDAEKGAIRARLLQGTMAAPRFIGAFRRAEDGGHQPASGAWWEVQREGAALKAVVFGEQTPAGWEGRVERHQVRSGGQTLDPAQVELALEAIRPHRAGKPHGTWLTYEHGRLARQEPWVEGRLEGTVRELDEQGEVVAEIPYVGGERSGVAWRRRADGTTWTVHYQPGGDVSPVTIDYPASSPLLRETFPLDFRDWENPSRDFEGWHFVEPRRGSPYLIFVDGQGRRIQETRTPAPEGVDGYGDLFADRKRLVLDGGKSWVGQVRGGKPHGWGRLYDRAEPTPLSSFEEGLFADGRPVGYTFWAGFHAKPENRAYCYRYYELYREGKAVPERRGSLSLSTRAERKEWEAAQRRYDEWAARVKVEAVLAKPLRYTPRVDAERGVVRWSNGSVTEGEPVTSLSHLRREDVVWVDCAAGRGVSRVVSAQGQQLTLLGVGTLTLEPGAVVRRFPELSTSSYRRRFGEECKICDGRGYSIAHYTVQGESMQRVTYVDSSGRSIGTGMELVGHSALVEKHNPCSFCDGNGEDLGSWGRWTRKR